MLPFVHSAIEKRRVDRVDWYDPVSIKLFKIIRHPFYKVLMTGCVFLLMSLTFSEEPTTHSLGNVTDTIQSVNYAGGHWCPRDGAACKQKSWMLIIETITTTVLACDLVLHVYMVSIKTYFKDWHKIAWFICIVYMMIDLLFTQYIFPARRIFRFSRLLRPIYILRTRRTVRNIFFATIETIPNLKEYIAFLMVVIFCFAVAGIQLFGPSVADWKNETTSGRLDGALYNSHETIVSTGSNVTVEVELFTEHFNFIGGALVSLMVLCTGENYPDVMKPAVEENQYHIFFFVLYVVITLFIFMPVLMAIIFEHYKRHHGVRLLQEKKLSSEERSLLRLTFSMRESRIRSPLKSFTRLS